MARQRNASTAAPVSARRTAASLGPGLHPANVQAIVAVTGATAPAGPRYRVKLPDGRTMTAAPLAGVDPALVEQCLRDGKLVLLLDAEGGPAIAGALQTAPSIAPDGQGRLALDAKHLRLRAGETLEIEAPGTALRMDPDGALRMEGDRLVIDMAALVRIFSGKVEIP